MNFLKKEISKKTIGGALIESVISAIIFTIVLYFCLTSFNETIQTMLKAISGGKTSALDVTMILFPIILIIALTLKLGTIIIKLYCKK